MEAESDVHRLDSEAILRTPQDVGEDIGGTLTAGNQDRFNITEIISVVVLSEASKKCRLLRRHGFKYF